MPTAQAYRTPTLTLLDGLFRTAVEAAHPAHCLPAHLPAPPAKGRLIILAAGKAAGAMTEVAERHYLDEMKVAAERLTGLAVTRHGYARPTRRIEMIEAGHPVPDAAGLAAAERVLKLADAATADDLVLVLMSGGASANWIAPADGIALRRQAGGDTRAAALRRQHRRDEHGAQASLAHQGRPARSCARSRRTWSTLAISDVPGDDPAVIGSGPTVPDPRRSPTRAPCWRATGSMCRRRCSARSTIPPTNRRSPVIRCSHPTEYKLIARPADAFRAAETAVRAAGYECVMLGDRIEGEARAVAAEHASRALALQAQGRRAVMLSGGELTVTIRGKGRGGPNQEYALALALALEGGARDRGACRRHRRHRRRRRRGRRPGRRHDRSLQRCRARKALGLDPARFLPTTIPPDFSSGSAIWSPPDRPART